MCGIAGIIRTDGRPVDGDVLGRMADLLAHRGPDEQGLWTSADRAVGLAARRLAVIDPPGSHQPMANEDGSVRAVFNGEIFNFRDLRRRLARAGHRFASAGDTEVLVHLYEDEGPAMLGRLDGMFALAVWDARRRRLLLARDRLGQKPLYWWHGRAGLVFASEAAALVACPQVPRRLDRRALGPFLRFGYVPAPATGFEGVFKLPPAHCLVFDAADGRLDGPRRWWDIPRGPVPKGPGGRAGAAIRPAEWRERVRAALDEAVRERLVADVPLGVLLSGGLDSSIIATLAAAHTPGPLRTFTARFDEPGWDESPYARMVAERLGARHTEVRIAPRCIETLEALVRRHGEPFADSSALAVYHLARQVRRDATVVLSGDGGDESFGGYPRHAALALSQRMPSPLRRALALVGRRMPPRAGRKSTWNAARRFLADLDAEPLERYLAWRSLFGAPAESTKRGPYGPRLRGAGAFGAARTGCASGCRVREPASLADVLTPDAAREALADDPLARWRDLVRGLDDRPWTDRAMAIDLQDYLPNDCLAKVDTASMAHALEVRSPMLDHHVVTLARGMPQTMKWRRRAGRPPEGKRVLREAFANDLPPEVLRRGKMGFGVPVSRWLATDYADWARGVLLDPGARSRGLVRREAAEALLDAHVARRADHGERIWALLCLELWMQAFGL